MDTEAVPSLVGVLAGIPAFRQARGKRHPLLPVLLRACVATRCGYRSPAAIAAWGANDGAPWLKRRGFTRERGPSESTVRRLLRGVAVGALERALRAWAEQVMQRLTSPAADAPLDGVALDGKRLRGSRRQGAADSPLLSALSHRLGVALGQVAVADQANEIVAAEGLLASLVLTGRVITADALLTPRGIAQPSLDRGGDYLLVVKEHQPTRYAALAAAVAPAAAPPGAGAAAREVTVQRGRLAQRQLPATTALAGYTAWPGAGQVLKLERRGIVKRTGALRQATAYAVTALAPARATPAQWLTLWRQHWHIENKLHWVRDVTFGEDRAQVRAGTLPQALAAIRNAASALLRLRGETNIAAGCRRYAAQPQLACAAVGLPPL
jgi:predicted transposase YbfD/YdcC